MKLALLAAAALAVAAVPAAAVTYAYTYASTGGDIGSGRLTTATPGLAAITGITGTFDGSAVTALSPYASADNNINPAGPYVTFSGVSVSTAGGTDYNLYFDGSNYNITDSVNDPGGSGSGARNLTSFTVSQVPEPATWGLLLAGFGMVGVAARRRKSMVVAA